MWEGQTNEPAETRSGLTQGCLLSPVLLMIYLSDLGSGLERSIQGDGLSYLEAGKLIEQILPGFTYADGIVTCAQRRYELQRLADVCSREGDKLVLRFSKEKSGIMVFNDIREPIKVQGGEVEKVGKYDYMGV